MKQKQMGATRAIVAMGLLAAFVACGGNATPAESQIVPPVASAATHESVSSASNTAASVAPADSASVTPPVRLEMPPSPVAVVKYTGFATPEGVFYDAKNDRYLVSNINGSPLDVDNNGYISELSPEGKVTKEKWIAGGVAKVTLNAPKGLAISGGTLYVADLDHVRMFDAKSGAPKGSLAITGATFLNDVTAGPDGKVYTSDSGLKAGKEDFDPTGTDAVYVIEKGKSKVLFKSTDLNRPNGIAVTKKGVYVNSFGAPEVYRLDAKLGKQDIMKTPKGGLDGLAIVGDTVYASSWEGMSVYRAPLGGVFEPMLTGMKAPADFAIDTKRNRIVVPRFMDNTVEVYEIPPMK